MKVHVFPQPFILAVALSLLVAFSAQAAEKKWEFAIDSAAEFEAQAVEIRNEMRDGRYSHLTERDRAAVDSNLNRVTRLLNKRDELSQLSNRDQVELVNAQERINAVLTENDPDRIVCKLEAKVGTRMKTKNCLTVREWAVLNSAAERTARDIRHAGGALPRSE